MSKDIPNPIAEDAPDPQEFEPGETVDATIRINGRRYAGADYDGERHCADCVNVEYLKLGIEDPYQIPFGGPLPAGAEVDCPGSSCGNCHRRISQMTTLHYDGVCGEYCTQ